jgi:hypothetical protein
MKQPTLTREQVEQALYKHGGKMRVAADSIPISYSQFCRYVKYYGLKTVCKVASNCQLRSIYYLHNGDVKRIARAMQKTTQNIYVRIRALGLPYYQYPRITITSAEARAAVAQHGSISAAAKALGLKYSDFYYILKRKRDNEVL